MPKIWNDIWRNQYGTKYIVSVEKPKYEKSYACDLVGVTIKTKYPLSKSTQTLQYSYYIIGRTRVSGAVTLADAQTQADTKYNELSEQVNPNPGFFVQLGDYIKDFYRQGIKR